MGGFLVSSTTFAKVSESKIKYRTTFGTCPARSAGSLALKLVKVFESHPSLMALKQTIKDEELQDRHFLSDYKISYNPLQKRLEFQFECPKALMKAQIYKNNGLDSYEAILVENGSLYDPTYEALLREEHKLALPLPTLALPIGDMDKEGQLEIAKLVKGLDWSLKKNLSEVILGEKKDLTIILSINSHPISVFMGNEEWALKLDKLDKIVKHMSKRGQMPVVINMTNSKKVVVKFSDKI